MSPIRDEPGHFDPNAGSGSSVGSSWAPGSRQGSRSGHAMPTSARKTAESTEEHPLSFTDKVVKAAGATGSSALFGTLELLKLAGGATLSTTGKIISPSIQVTRQVVFPALWSALTDYYEYIAPPRLKDWFRIVTSSLHHFITVLTNTHKGIVFQKKVVNVGRNVVDCLSSDASRQVIVDGMSTVVKLAEALHTPETKALLDQISVLGSRLVDAAASGRNKQLIKDTQEAVWAFCQLASDPSTTLALAEVTACLCHALEMEEAIHRNQPIPNQLAAQRRYERNQFQHQTFVDPDTMQDPDSTVEQVILSSLGGASEDPYGCVPQNVMIDHHPTETHTAATDSEIDLQGEDWKNAARESVDVGYLYEKISQRASGMERQQILRTTVTTTAQSAVSPSRSRVSMRREEELKVDIEDLVVETVEDDDGSADSYTIRRQSTMRQSNVSKPSKTKAEDSHKTVAYGELENDGINGDESGTTPIPDPPPLATIDTEQATSRFFRCLDELMEKKRSEALRSVLGNSYSTKTAVWYPKAAAAAGAGNERGQDTMKQRMRDTLATTRSVIGVGGSTKTGKTQQPLKEKETELNIVIVTLIGFVALTWFVLGCYGLYAIIFGSPKPSELNLESLFSKPSAPATEVVIRVVREIVHVSSDGSVLQTIADASPLNDVNMDEVTECIAAAVK